MKPADDKVMAYVDGELDPASRAEVEAAIASDPELAGWVREQLELRRKLGGAFDRVLSEPVPQRLIDTVRTAPAGKRVTDLATARAERTARAPGPWSGGVWLALAASLLLGLFLGITLLHSPTLSPFTLHEGTLVARGDIAEVLTRQLASTQRTSDSVTVGITFRDHAGDYCRTFVLREGRPFGGVACRQGDEWAVQALSRYPQDTPQGEYRPAAGELPPGVLAVVEDRIAGEPLDAQAEETARRNSWRQNQ